MTVHLLDIRVHDRRTSETVDRERWRELASDVLADLESDRRIELSLTFVDEPEMAELNSRYMGKPGSTDVLSFPVDGHPDRADSDPEIPVMLGDVVICPAVARRQASTSTGSYEDEVAFLVVHGILHLLGMDHTDPADATAMRSRERSLLDRYHHRS